MLLTQVLFLVSYLLIKKDIYGVLSLEFEVGSPIIKVNGNPITMDFPTEIWNGRTVVALRDIVEAIGGVLSWQAENEYHKTKAFAEM